MIARRDLACFSLRKAALEPKSALIPREGMGGMSRCPDWPSKQLQEGAQGTVIGQGKPETVDTLRLWDRMKHKAPG